MCCTIRYGEDSIVVLRENPFVKKDKIVATLEEMKKLGGDKIW